MGYTERFGTGTIQSTQVSYLALNPTGNVSLDWPKETAPSPNLLATIVDVNSGSTSVSISLPDATQGSTGAEFLFNNLGAVSVTFLDDTGGNVLVLPAGQAWVVYLADNTTAAGVWRTFQLGAFTSQAQASNLAGTGLIAIGNTLAGDLPSISFSATGTSFVLTDRAKAYRWTGGAGNCNLPSSGAVPVGWYMRLRNDGTGALTVNPTGGDTINGAASLIMQQGDSCLILCAAAGIMDTYGLGKSITSTFDYTTIAVPGTGTYTLSGAELNRISYKFTGVLTGDRTIVVPATVQQYWITNATTGAFNFFVKTAAQIAPGILVATNQASILYCDGTNVVPGDTVSGGLSNPVTIAQGGTNATTAGAARTNLGSTAIGDALFITASAAAARATLDAASLTQTNTFTNTNTFSSNAAGAGINPVATLDRNKGAAGAANDFLGQLKFAGRNSANAFFEFSSIVAQLLDPVAGTEDGRLIVFTPIAGTAAERLYVGAGIYSKNTAGGDKGVDTANFITLYENNVSLASKYIAISLLTVDGDIIIRSGGAPTRLAIGAANRVLTVSGGLPAWVAPTGVSQNTYDSGDQAITSAGALSLTHGLGGTPTGLLTLLHCTTGEFGYSAGDFIVIPPNSVGGSGNNFGFNAKITSTQVIIRYGSSGGGVFRVLDGSLGNSTTLTDANWRLVVRAQRVF